MNCVCAESLSGVQLFATPWTVAHHTPLSRDSPSKNAGVGCHALLQGIFPTQASNPYLPHCRCILYWATKEVQEYWVCSLSLLQGNFSNPGIEPGSPALQADFLLAELPGKPGYELYVYKYSK